MSDRDQLLMAQALAFSILGFPDLSVDMVSPTCDYDSGT